MNLTDYSSLMGSAGASAASIALQHFSVSPDAENGALTAPPRLDKLFLLGLRRTSPSAGSIRLPLPAAGSTSRMLLPSFDLRCSTGKEKRHLRSSSYLRPSSFGPASRRPSSFRGDSLGPCVTTCVCFIFPPMCNGYLVCFFQESRADRSLDKGGFSQK